MRALNRRSFTLRANQTCKPKDLLLKIPVENFEQLTLDRPSLLYDLYKNVSVSHAWSAARLYKTRRFRITLGAILQGFAPAT
jgi:hypothetical protein